MFTFVKPRRAVTRVFLHCTASDNPAHDSVAVIRSWHIANGWSDIGYHLLVHKDGTVDAGRSMELTPAAQAGNNTGTIAICCHGLLKELFTEAQFATVRDLAKQINAAYGGAVTFHGHCEVAAKTCPVYDYRAVLGLDGRGRLDAIALPSTDADDPVEITRTLRCGSRGDDVRWLQACLGKIVLLDVAMDGDFGPQTEAAVKAFQAAHHLTADGIYGPLSREAMSEEIDALSGRAAG